MVFNVKQLIRLKQKREEEMIQKNESNVELQLEIIRRKNQIEVILANGKNVDKLNKISAEVMLPLLKNKY